MSIIDSVLSCVGSVVGDVGRHKDEGREVLSSLPPRFPQLSPAGNRRRNRGGLDFQSVEVADMRMWETGDCEGTEAGMAVMSFEFEPLLGGREVAIYGPKQHGPLQTLL